MLGTKVPECGQKVVWPTDTHTRRGKFPRGEISGKWNSMEPTVGRCVPNSHTKDSLWKLFQATDKIIKTSLKIVPMGNHNHRWEIRTTGGKSEISGKSEPQVEIKHHSFWFRSDKSGTLCEQKCVFFAYTCDMYLCVQCNCQEDKKRYSKSLWRGSWV